MLSVKASTSPHTENALTTTNFQLGGGAPLSFILPRHRNMFLPRTSNYGPELLVPGLFWWPFGLLQNCNIASRKTMQVKENSNIFFNIWRNRAA
jgi:hypothetical protein